MQHNNCRRKQSVAHTSTMLGTDQCRGDINAFSVKWQRGAEMGMGITSIRCTLHLFHICEWGHIIIVSRYNIYITFSSICLDMDSLGREVVTWEGWEVGVGGKQQEPREKKKKPDPTVSRLVLHLTLLFAALWQIQCWWCTGPGQEGKMKIYCEWENKWCSFPVFICIVHQSLYTAQCMYLYTPGGEWKMDGEELDRADI